MYSQAKNAGLFFCLLIGSAPAAEQLTNPFGGRPPENSPGVPDEPPLSSRIERWTGAFLGYRRDIVIMSEFFRTGRDSFISMESSKGDELCVVEARDFSVSDTDLYIPPNVGGCWRVLGNDRYVDLGGARYGSLRCNFRPVNKSGTCVYTSGSTGKQHRFSVTATEYETFY